MAKTTKTSITASSPVMSMGGTDMIMKKGGVIDPTEVIERRGSYQFPSTSSIMSQYSTLRNQLGLSYDNIISTRDLLNRAGLKLSLVERDWPTLSQSLASNPGFAFPSLVVLMRNLNDAGLDLQAVRVRSDDLMLGRDGNLVPASLDRANSQEFQMFDSLARAALGYVEYLRSMGVDPIGTNWYPSMVGVSSTSPEPDINSWVKKTGFQAPSMTKGSNGLLGDCSMTGQVITGLVVGGAILALYKTCKK